MSDKHDLKIKQQSTMDPFIIMIAAAVILLILVYIVWKIAQKLIINSIIGLIILGILYFLEVKFTHLLLVFVITVIFGIPGILVVLFLKFFGIDI